MNQEQFVVFVERFIEEQRQLLKTKGGEYAGPTDRLGNFKGGAKDLDIIPLVVWRVYAGKHWDSITTYVRDAISGRVRERSEPIRGRLLDLANYCILAAALIEEGEAKVGPTKAKLDELASRGPRLYQNHLIYDEAAWAPNSVVRVVVRGKAYDLGHGDWTENYPNLCELILTEKGLEALRRQGFSA